MLALYYVRVPSLLPDGWYPDPPLITVRKRQGLTDMSSRSDDTVVINMTSSSALALGIGTAKM